MLQLAKKPTVAMFATNSCNHANTGLIMLKTTLNYINKCLNDLQPIVAGLQNVLLI